MMVASIIKIYFLDLTQTSKQKMKLVTLYYLKLNYQIVELGVNINKDHLPRNENEC